MQTILMWVAGVSLFLAAAFSGGLVSGDRLRANYYSEGRADRAWRTKAMRVCLGVGLVSGLLAWAAAKL